MLYTDFVAELGFALDLGQWVFARVAFDGVDPCDLAPEHRAIADAMLGGIDRLDPGARAVICAVCGGRAGKTRMFAMRLLHLALTVPLPTLAPGEFASAPIIAPDMALASQPLDYIKGACRHPDILPWVMHERDLSPQSEGIDLLRDDGKRVEIVIRSASGKGRSGRGRTLVGALLDEAAIFYDSTYKINDDEMFRSVRPRVEPGGQTLVASTPWTQTGLLYSLFAANHGRPGVAGIATPARREGHAVAIHAPSTVFRADPRFHAMVDAERVRDAENASREFDAQFMGAGAETFFEAQCINQCVDFDRAAEVMPRSGDETTAGADLGFSTNSSALAIGHIRDGVIEIGMLREWKPEDGKPLKPSAVAREMAVDMKRHGATVVMSDAHYRETFVEHLSDAGLGFLDAPVVPAEAYVRARTLLREGKVRIPNNERLLRMMRETTAKKTASGGVQIQKPRWRSGEHADLLDAFVLCLYQLAGEVVRAPSPSAGSREYYEAQERERIARRIREAGQAKKPFWKRGVG